MPPIPDPFPDSLPGVLDPINTSNSLLLLTRIVKFIWLFSYMQYFISKLTCLIKLDFLSQLDSVERSALSLGRSSLQFSALLCELHFLCLSFCGWAADHFTCMHYTVHGCGFTHSCALECVLSMLSWVALLMGWVTAPIYCMPISQ